MEPMELPDDWFGDGTPGGSGGVLTMAQGVKIRVILVPCLGHVVNRLTQSETMLLGDCLEMLGIPPIFGDFGVNGIGFTTQFLREPGKGLRALPAR